MRPKEFKCVYKNWEDKPVVKNFTVGKQYVIHRIYSEKWYLDCILNDKCSLIRFDPMWKWNFVPLSLSRKWKLKEINKLSDDI